jgi:hypothetical protein
MAQATGNGIAYILFALIGLLLPYFAARLASWHAR